MRMRLNPLILTGIGASFIWGLFFGIQLYSASGARRNIYWTPRALSLHIGETRDSFEIFIKGKSIHEHLAEKTLLALEPGSHTPLSAGDIEVRLNNWYKVRTSFLIHALWSGMLFSSSLTLLLAGIFQALVSERKRALE